MVSMAVVFMFKDQLLASVCPRDFMLMGKIKLRGKVRGKSSQERVDDYERCFHPFNILVNVVNLPPEAHVDHLFKFLDLLV